MDKKSELDLSHLKSQAKPISPTDRMISWMWIYTGPSLAAPFLLLVIYLVGVPSFAAVLFSWWFLPIILLYVASFHFLVRAGSSANEHTAKFLAASMVTRLLAICVVLATFGSDVWIFLAGEILASLLLAGWALALHSDLSVSD